MNGPRIESRLLRDLCDRQSLDVSEQGGRTFFDQGPNELDQLAAPSLLGRIRVAIHDGIHGDIRPVVHSRPVPYLVEEAVREGARRKELDRFRAADALQDLWPRERVQSLLYRVLDVFRAGSVAPARQDRPLSPEALEDLLQPRMRALRSSGFEDGEDLPARNRIGPGDAMGGTPARASEGCLACPRRRRGRGKGGTLFGPIAQLRIAFGKGSGTWNYVNSHGTTWRRRARNGRRPDFFAARFL